MACLNGKQLYNQATTVALTLRGVCGSRSGDSIVYRYASPVYMKAQSCPALISSSMVLESSKSAVPHVPQSLAGVEPKRTPMALCGCSRVHTSVMGGSCFSMNRFTSTISSGQAL